MDCRRQLMLDEICEQSNQIGAAALMRHGIGARGQRATAAPEISQRSLRVSRSASHAVIPDYPLELEPLAGF
jgi:hypothetical protein